MSRDTNNTGRSTGRQKVHNIGKIEGSFIMLTRELLESPAWRVLTLADRKILDRLCIEHMAHAGTENGNLKCTFTNFEEHGIRRSSIAGSIRRLEALGLIRVVERGGITRAEFKFPSIYRLTFIQGNIPATNEWKRIGNMTTARQVTAKANENYTHRRKQKTSVRNKLNDK
ncbi:MAG: hypothetical protein GY751_07130 [Bacteroidetes bacterium]|nr:hypothetical protein [Bacteroidota bacterium]